MLERVSVIVYYKSPKILKQLNKFGHVTYFHKKRRYAVLYINLKDEDEVISTLSKFRHVRKVERSQLDREAYIINELSSENT